MGEVLSACQSLQHIAADKQEKFNRAVEAYKCEEPDTNGVVMSDSPSQPMTQSYVLTRKRSTSLGIIVFKANPGKLGAVRWCEMVMCYQADGIGI